MANLTAILGNSGSGKSTGIGENIALGISGLNPEDTLIINVINKPLPFKGWSNKFSVINGNYVHTANCGVIIGLLDKIAEKSTKKEFKNIVIDDFQYIMASKFMDDAKKAGYQKFTDLALDIWNILNKATSLPDDINVFVLCHTETLNDGTTKAKTIGKLLDEKITLEGLFTTVLYAESELKDNEPKKTFRTQSNGMDTAKSPHGMFEDLYIPNDLGYVARKINEYNK